MDICKAYMYKSINVYVLEFIVKMFTFTEKT